MSEPTTATAAATTSSIVLSRHDWLSHSWDASAASEAPTRLRQPSRFATHWQRGSPSRLHLLHGIPCAASSTKLAACLSGPPGTTLYHHRHPARTSSLAMDLHDVHGLGLLTAIATVTIIALVWFRRALVLSASSNRLRKATITFRVRGVPLDWDGARLRSFLADQANSDGPDVWPLAREVKGVTQTATVSFRDIPSPLRNRSTTNSWKLRIPGDSTRSRSIMLDDGFLGLTTLYSPPLEDHKIDIIAISGLGGHAFGSFKERNGEHMWLRDSLPYELTYDKRPMARILIYGFESTVPHSKSFQNLEDLATGLHPSLRKLVDASTSRPIIFIAHSLGGLIIKQISIILSRSNNDDDRRLLRAIYGIAFFGVPHDGMNIQSLIPIVRNQPNQFLIESIRHFDSEVLRKQQREFHRALGGEGESGIIYFYETLESTTARKGWTGNWAMNGPKTILVSKSSATHCRSWEDGPQHICAINRTHSDMVKFKLYDEEYDKALQRLEDLVQQALETRNGTQASATKQARVEMTTPQNSSGNPRPEHQDSSRAQSSGRVELCGIGGANNSMQVITFEPTCDIVAQAISAGENCWQLFGTVDLRHLANIRRA